MIKVRDLTKRFSAATAVDRLSFTVAKGEVLGFLGPNGAGKTTTMRILTGFLPPTSGGAFIAGFDVVDQSIQARRAVGYLPENIHLYVDMRVGEYLRFVAGAKGLAGDQARAETRRVMDAGGIADRAGQLIKQLSKGYRQRVGLAQALLGDPPVLILDEPTIGLDPRQIVEIRSLIKSFAGQKTVILSSHILPEVAATCSRVVIINQGRMVVEGPPSMLMPQGDGCLVRLVGLGPAQELAAVVSRVDGVTAVRAEDPPAGQEGVCVLQLDTTGVLPVRAAVAKAVVQAGHQLLELAPMTVSLEEVFVQLTTEDKGQDAPEAVEVGKDNGPGKEQAA
jgi:ABC-2 type transport system ATP-binding protein